LLEPLSLAHVAQALANIRYLHSTLSKMATDFPWIWIIRQEYHRTCRFAGRRASITVFGGRRGSGFRLRYIYLHCGSMIRTRRHKMLSNLERFCKVAGRPEETGAGADRDRGGKAATSIPVEKKKIEAKHESKASFTMFPIPVPLFLSSRGKRWKKGNELRGFVNEERREVERILTSLSVGSRAARERNQPGT